MTEIENAIDSISESTLLEKWRTNAATTVGGILLMAFINGALNVMERSVTTYVNAMILDVLSIAVSAVTLCYAVFVYPKYFSDSSLVDSPNTISFLNGFFGGVIFGCLWNTCLTKKQKGISYIVATVFCGLSCLIYLFDLYALMLYY